MLKTYRKKIDKIDAEMKDLFLKRFELIEDVAEYKKKKGLKVSDAAREEELIINLTKDIQDPKVKKLYKTYLDNLLLLSKDYQKDIIDD